MDKHVKILGDADWKFVQLYINGEPIFRAESAYYNSHSTILEKVLSEHGISFNHDEGRIGDVVSERGERYEAVGMGLMILGDDAKSYDLGGRSIDYGLTPNQEHLDRLKQYVVDIKFEII